MTKTKSTKRALLMSALSLLLCVSMLIGSTFAWFTDSVVSGNNIIKSGNLDIELEYWDDSDWKTVNGASDIFTNTLWEPGVTEVAYLRVANTGSLELKYQLGINILDEIAGKNQANKTFKLSDYIMFGVVENVNGEFEAYTKDDAGRAAAIAAVTDAKKISAGYTKASTMAPNDELYLALVVYMPTTVDNVANHNGTDIPQIDLGVNVYATQKDAESDSFGSDYDKDSSAFVSTAAELRTAIATVKDGGTVYVNDGVYNIDSQLNISGKSINIVGVGENVVIHSTITNPGYNKIFYIYGSATEGEDITVNISNVTLTSNIATKSDIWIRTDTANGAKVSGDVTVNLDDVTCTSIICDNNYVNGDTVNLNITNSKVKKVTLDASPFNGNGLNTYTNLTYNASRIDSINIQTGVNDLTHIKINGVNPTAHGEQQPLTYVDTAEELQDALDNAVDGDILVLGADITGDVTATQKADVKVTVDGNGNTFAGVITVDGRSATYTTAGLTIKNMTFKADVINADACIQLGNGTSATRYTCNVTVDNCTFDVPGAVGVKSYTGGDKNLTITGCTATADTHSLVQAKGIDGVLVEKCKVYSKNGLNFNNSDNVTVDGCTVDVKGYAVRFGESSGGVGAAETYTIKNSALKSANDDGDAIIVLRGTADYSTLTVTNTTLTGDIQIKDTASKATIIIDGKYYVSTADELADAVATGKTDIYLLDGEYDVYGCGGKTLTLTGSKNAVIKLYNDDENGCDYAFGGADTGVGNVTFNGVTFDTTSNTGNYKGFAYMKGTFNDCNFVGAYSLNNANDFVFNRCTFDFQNGYFWTWAANSVTFDGCTFNGNSKAILAHGYASTVINIKDCTFAATEKGYTGSGDNTAAVEIDPAGTNTYAIEFSGTNTKTDSYADWTRVKNGSTGHTITGLS